MVSQSSDVSAARVSSSLCICFLPFGLISSSLLSQTELLPSFPDFLHLVNKSSPALWKDLQAQTCSLLPEDSFPQGPIDKLF